MTSQRLALVFGGSLLVAVLAFSLPFTTGVWDPDLLRVAEEPEVLDLSIPSMEAGQARAPFHVEQRGYDGALLWSLSGDRVRGQAGVFVHEVTSPRLIAVREGTRVELTAQRGRVHLPAGASPETAQPVRVELEGAVLVHAASRGAAATLRTEAITVSADREAADRIRISGKRQLHITIEGVEGAPWVMTAPEVGGTLAPLALRVSGPVGFRSGLLTVAPFAGESIAGTLQGGLTVTRPEGSEAVTVECAGVDGRTQGDDPSEVVAERLVLALAKPAADKDTKDTQDTDSAAGLSALSLQSAELTGSPVRITDASRGAWIRAPKVTLKGAGPPTARATSLAARGGVAFGLRDAQATPPRTWEGRADSADATLEGGTPGLQALRALHLDGGDGVVTIVDPGGGSDLRLAKLDYTVEGDDGLLRVEGLQGQLDLETGRKARPWKLAARRSRARVDRAALAAEVVDWRAAILQADLEGDVDLRRLAKEPKRRRGLRGHRLTWSEDGLVRLIPDTRGPQVEVVLGASTIRARSVDYRPESGALEVRGGLRFTSEVPARGDTPAGTIEAEAERGWAILSSDPEVWQRDQQARRVLRRAAKGKRRRRVLPTALDSLTLVGGPKRVRLTGPRGLRAEADQVTYSRPRAEAILTAKAKAPPVRVAGRDSEISCRRLRVLRFEPAGREGPSSLWISADGDVVARGVAVGKAGSDRLGVDCGWFACLVREPTGEETKDLQLQRCFAGGKGGVKVVLVPAKPGSKAPERVALVTKALEADGEQRLPDGRTGLRLLLKGAWRGELTLPNKGPARINGGSLDALVDVAALRASRPKDQPEEALLRSVLSSLQIQGGLEVIADGLQVRADRADLDPDQGAYVLRGKPVVISRGGLSQEAPVQVLRLADE